MKLSSLLTAVAVIGAVAVGGAVTGTTLALWRDQAALAASSVSSGSIALGVTGAGSLAALEPGVAQVLTRTLSTSTSAGKNLRMTFHLDGVTSTVPALGNNDDLEVSATTITSGTCSAAATGFKAVGNAYTSTALTAVGAGPGSSTTLCLTVRLDADAPAAARGLTANLDLTLRGQQVRP